MSIVRRQQPSFSTHEHMFLSSSWHRKCPNPGETWTPNLRIHAECQLSYRGQTFIIPCFEIYICMMTSSNGNIFRVTGHLCGYSPVPGEFPTQRPVTRSFDVFFDLRLNKRLSKQSWGWWYETLSCPLWRHCNGISQSTAVRHAFWMILIAQGKRIRHHEWTNVQRYKEMIMYARHWILI